MKLIKIPIGNEIALKVADALEEQKKEELIFRKILFRFIREHQEVLERADPHTYKRKFDRGYMGDLKNNALAGLVRKVISWKEAREAICKECIIKVNCSKQCPEFTEQFTSPKKERKLDGQGGNM